MKFKVLILVFVIISVALIAFSKMNRRPFAPAEDFPRDALVYVQISDLPSFIKLWSNSDFKKKHTLSENFEDFTNSHLGLKLASRWQEFNNASGFPLDVETLSSLTENRASIALYDIGKLDFVFIAPVSDEVFAATKFIQNQDKFSEETLEDGTIIYRANVEADRGRQKQELIFTNLKGRFVLVTNEKLLVQTLNNINGNKLKNRLVDTPSFKILSEKTELHTAAVWVNQKILNNDYYFKHYWLMLDIKSLENIRAGIFDFEMQEGKFIEHRQFLLNKKVETLPLPPAQTAEMLSYLPEDTPFYRLQSANSKTISETIGNTFFSRREMKNEERSSHFYSSSFDDYDDYSYNNYNYLGEKFDEAIDEDDENETVERSETDVDFSKLIQAANPQSVLTFTRPVVLPAPLFIEFRRGSIFRLASPANFDRDLFESAIEKNLSAQVMISAPNIKLKWETKTEKDLSWRELKLPMLEWKIIYMLRGSELILADNTNFLSEILNAANSQTNEKPNSPLNGLTVLNLEHRDENYDKVFEMISENNAVGNFFTGNVKSLFDSASDVKKIEIKEQYLENILDEEIVAVFK
jgi:hypothetical protein